MKKLISFLLACILLLSMFGCQDGKAPEQESGETSDGTDTTEAVDYLQTLPKHDDGWKEFRILVTEQLKRFYDQENISSIPVDNAAYKRNLAVEELFKTDFSYTALDGNASGSAAFAAEIRISTMAGGADGYDLILGQSYYTLPSVSSGTYHNLLESDMFNWDADWYHQDINSSGTINGKLWAASGSFVISQLAYAMACFYSKDVYENMEFEYDLYDLARDGNWTYETYYELVTAFDNPDQTQSGGMYGMIRHDHGITGLLMGMGVDFVTKNSDGEWTFDEFYNSRFLDAYEKLRSLCNDYPSAMLTTTDIDIPRGALMARTLFVQTLVDAILTDELLMPSDDFTIGVLPIPKYDENQANYRTRVMRDELFLIPICADLKRSALITEALNYTTYTMVDVAYWDTALEHRAADVEDDMEMLSIIRDTVYWDTAQYFNYDLQNVTSKPTVEIMKNSASFSVWWAQNKKALGRQLGELISIYG